MRWRALFGSNRTIDTFVQSLLHQIASLPLHLVTSSGPFESIRVLSWIWTPSQSEFPRNRQSPCCHAVEYGVPRPIPSFLRLMCMRMLLLCCKEEA